jgi:hypothetical protein
MNYFAWRQQTLERVGYKSVLPGEADGWFIGHRRVCFTMACNYSQDRRYRVFHNRGLGPREEMKLS